MPKLFDHAARERLLDAVVNNEIDELRALVEEGYPVGSFVVDEHGNTALSDAVWDRNLDEDGNIDEDAIEPHYQMIQYLIEIGSNLNVRVSKSTLIHIALRNPNIDPRIVELLYRYNPGAIDSYAIGLAEAHQNKAQLLTIIGRPDLIDEPETNQLDAADYFNSPEQALVTDGLNLLALNLHDITYNRDLTDIFKNLPALNMGEQKKFDQMLFNLKENKKIQKLR